VKYWRIYSATLINTFGSWCTFLAIALIVKERFGAQYVPMVFLVQTLPVILFSRGMVKLIAPQAEQKWYVIIQVLFTLNSLVLLLSSSLPAIFVHLFMAAVLKGLSGPLYNMLLTDMTEADDRKLVFTRVDSLIAGALALAPPAGAWVKIFFSSKALFAIDAASFLIALVLLWPYLAVGYHKSVVWLNRSELKINQILYQVVHRPSQMPSVLWLPLVLWLTYQLVGALLNGLEFSIFSVKQMSEVQIGYALAAWGIGNLILFLVGQVNVRVSAGVYFLGLLLFIFLPSASGAIGSFLIAGFAYSALSGGLKSKLVASVPKEFNPLPVWSYANQLNQIFNLVCYLGAGVLLNSSHSWIMTVLVLLVAGLLWFGSMIQNKSSTAAINF